MKSYDVTRDATMALKGGVRDARIWGWPWLFLVRSETTVLVSWQLGTWIGNRNQFIVSWQRTI